MDVRMPGLDGLESAQRIQEIAPTPVVVITAFESGDLLQKASHAGVGAYLIKPSSAREVERAVTIATARFQDLMELKRLNAELESCLEEHRQLIQQHQEALERVKLLSGLLPICSSCKKIRDDSGYWNQIEEYIRDHSDAQFTHSLCPECVRRLYPELF